MTGYQPIVIPFNYKGINWSVWQDSNLRPPTSKAGRLTWLTLHTDNLAEGVGFEPTILISKTSALDLTRRTPNNWICKLCHHRYWHHSPMYIKPARTRYVTWDPSSVVSFTDLRSSPRVGVEPINLLLTWSFEETSLAWLHLLTLTKLGGTTGTWTPKPAHH